MDKKAIEMMYADKKAYVERDLAAALRPLRDFYKIEYARDAVQGDEYIKITEAIGSVHFVNVTGNSEEAILKEVCRMALEANPLGLIRTKDRQRQVNALFVQFV